MSRLLLACALVMALSSPLAAARKLVIIAGPVSHPPLMHEFRAGCLLLQKRLAAVPGLETVLVTNGWPTKTVDGKVVDDHAVFDGAHAIFIYSDGGGGHPAIQNDRLAFLRGLMQRGVGLGCAHYAVEVPANRGGAEWKEWIGGYYETAFSCNPIWDAEIRSLPVHPVTRGVKPFTTKDEWYFNMRFRDERTSVKDILVATPSDAVRDGPYVHPKGPYPHIQAAKGRPETLMWAVERRDGGRGFGFTGGHFHLNWQNDQQRRLILNALVWVTGLEVPPGGIDSAPVSDEEIMQNLDEKKPRPVPAVLAAMAAGGGKGAATATAATPTFRRGVNISHWLSQNNRERTYGAGWFTEEDVDWIARQGFDHIRFPIDGRLWLKPDGTIDHEKRKPFDAALAWTRARGLGAILDMHFLPGADFNDSARDTRVFEDAALMEKVARFWSDVARLYAEHGNYLRFELLNEAVAKENAQLNVFNRRMIAAIRESNPTRIIYIGSNRWNGFGTIEDLEIPADPNIAITLHYYEPMVFTHQRASWVAFKPTMPAVSFPGKVPDLSGHVPADGWAMKSSGRELTVAEVDAAYARVADWAKRKAPGREIHIGEFGVYRPADDASKQRWIETVRLACERHGFGWAVWDYQGGFAVRDADGKATVILRGLLPNAPK